MAKILVVSQHYWPEDFRLNDLTELLVENRHEVTVLTGQPNYPNGITFTGYKWWKFSIQNHKGLKIYRVPLWPRRSGSAINLFINYLSFLFFTFLVIPFFIFKKFDHVIAWGTSPIFQGMAGGLIAFFKRIPFSVWVLDLWPESLIATNTIKNKFVLKSVLLLVKIFYAFCDNILCTSESFIEHIKNQGVNTKKLKLFPNWAEDLYKESSADHFSENFKFPAGTILTYAGNLGLAQDIENLFTAMKILKDVPDLHFIILGDGRLKPWLEQNVEAEGLKNVHILGRFPSTSMAYFFKHSHALLVTLKKEDIFSKTLPGRVMSFMAAGKPLIGAAGGETDKVIIQSQSGLSVAPGNPQALADSIKKFINLPATEKEQFALNSRTYFNEFFAREKVYPRLKKLIGLSS